MKVISENVPAARICPFSIKHWNIVIFEINKHLQFYQNAFFPEIVHFTKYTGKQK